MRVTLLILCLLPLAAVAETAYVTDVLRLEVRAAPDSSERPFRVIESGTELEILGREGFYARVQLADGVVGYVSAGYLVTQKPARLIVAETQSEVDRLTGELTEMRDAFAEPAAMVERLQGQIAELDSAVTAANGRVDELTERNEDLERRQQQYQYSLPFTWVGGAILVCLIGGFIIGLWWVDHRSRKRHGGIRIY